MDLKFLVIEFGGLCLLMQRDQDPKGLFVLLPDAPAHMRHPRHCQMVVIDSPNTKDNKIALLPFHQDLDLRYLADESAPVPAPTEVALLSKLANDVGIEKKWASAPIGSPLMGRVILPLGSPIEIFGDSGKVHRQGHPGSFDVRGRAAVEVVAKPGISSLDIAGETVTPDDNTGVIRIAILNIPYAELASHHSAHSVGQVVEHIHAYKQFLPPGTPVDDLIADEQGGAGQHRDHACPTARQVLNDFPFYPAIGFIDPFNCTIGYGCQEETAHCV